MAAPVRCQVAVAGAGMVGSALALALARAGFEVALLEKDEPPPYKPSGHEDLRVSAVSLASEYLLRNLGVWAAIAAARISPYREMHVWDASGRGSLHFDCVALQQTHLGHIIENRLIQHSLLAELRATDGVQWLCPAAVSEFQPGTRRAVLRLADGREVYAQLVIAADGAGSPLREMAGIELDSWRYRQQGIVSTVTPEQHHGATAWQRFLPSGPLALLPLSDGRCSIVWSTGETEAERLLALDERAFREALTEASEARLGAITDCGRRAAFPLHYQHARAYVRPRLALVGDAAHVVHPLAGQGVNLGLLDCVALAGALAGARDRRADIGGWKTLRRYERARRGENQAMALAFDALNRLFANEATPLAWLRNTGLSTVDRLPSLKHFFMRRATGLAQAAAGADPSGLLIPPEFRA